jgi:predicted DCC family thiol-disulfide oxidoreductase YuxK
VNQWTLLYDATCGLCRRQVALVRHLDRRGHIALLDINSATARAHFPTITPQDARRELHLAAPHGTLSRGADAVRRTLLLLPPLAFVGAFMYAPGAMALARPAYAWVARNRHRLGKHTAVCESGVCTATHLPPQPEQAATEP